MNRLVRRSGLVLFETTKGERFSIAEDQVVSPPLESIPAAEGLAAPAAAPEPVHSGAPTPGHSGGSHAPAPKVRRGRAAR